MAKDIRTKKALDNASFEFKASNLLNGVSNVIKFGENIAVANGTTEDVWDVGGVFLYPPATELLDIISSVVADDAASTGARTVTVDGLDTNFVEQSETVSMGGTVAVNLVNSYLRVFNAFVLTAGTGEENAGSISVRTQTGGTVRASIQIGTNHALMAVYTVPDGKTGYLSDYYADLDSPPTGGDIEFHLRIREENQVFQVRHKIGLTDDGTSHHKHVFISPLVMPEHTDVRVEATNGGANPVAVSGGFDLILIDN